MIMVAIKINKTLWRETDKNVRISETKQAIWMGPTIKRSQRRGLQMPLSQVPYQSRFWGTPKKSHLDSNHVLATTGQSCQKEKVAFF